MIQIQKTNILEATNSLIGLQNVIGSQISNPYEEFFVIGQESNRFFLGKEPREKYNNSTEFILKMIEYCSRGKYKGIRCLELSEYDSQELFIRVESFDKLSLLINKDIDRLKKNISVDFLDEEKYEDSILILSLWHFKVIFIKEREYFMFYVHSILA